MGQGPCAGMCGVGGLYADAVWGAGHLMGMLHEERGLHGSAVWGGVPMAVRWGELGGRAV